MDQLIGIGFGGYRSFASDPITRLSPLGKINLIAGQNNAGKSNVLRVIHGMFQTGEDASRDVEVTGAWDRPAGEGSHRPRLEVGYTVDQILAAATVAFGVYAASLEQFLRGISEAPETPGFWLRYETGGVNLTTTTTVTDEWVLDVYSRQNQESRNAGQHLFSQFFNRYGGNEYSPTHSVLQGILSAVPPRPEVRTVSGVRQVGKDSGVPSTLTGSNLIQTLLHLQNPSTGRLDDRKVFLAIQTFVQKVLDDPDLTIDIPHDLTTIHITQNGNTLPIENYGTGVHEVVILAAAATVVQDSIMCIEEPEIHLHPMLQRKLLRYLHQETSNQYFIATHSAHLLDSSLGSVFHVQRVEGRSQVNYAGSAAQQSAICADLGYRPSDLVQSNAIIWVEGPSDRLYVKSWIDALAPDRFIEGLHYSIMFYGGRLLNSLTADDPQEVEEFISLRRLNRYMAVLMDSDKGSARSSVNETKKRIRDELAKDGGTGFGWITSCYTIENYVPFEKLSAAIEQVHPKAKVGATPDRWNNPLPNDTYGIKKLNKIGIARHITADWGTEWQFGLDRDVKRLIALIEAANTDA